MARRTETEKLWCSRLLERQDRSGISQAEMARRMSERLKTKWRQSRVWKLLYAEMPVSVLIFETAASVLGMSMDDLTCPNRDGKTTSDLCLSEPEIKLIQNLRMIQGTDHACTLLSTALSFNGRPADGRKRNGRKRVRRGRTPAEAMHLA